MTKHLLSIADLNKGEIYQLAEMAMAFKKNRQQTDHLRGKTLGMVFQKPSTRTAVSFAVAMYELGGLPLMLNAQDLQIKRGESLPDTARTLSRYLAGIMIRANKHEEVAELARHATIPIISGLTELEHPCQVLGDLLTMMEIFKVRRQEDLNNFQVTYIGDGNNVAHSWMLAAALMGFVLVVCSPEGYLPEKQIKQKADALLALSGGRIVYEKDPETAVRDASVVYTDVWASMGKDEERDQRKKIFTPYQINKKLMSHAPKNAVVMHCLPAHRGEEITDEVIDGPQSVVFDQAENRLHIQKAVLVHFLQQPK
ncbi:MAG TPA: ornithine carbamoyltransferase [Elusimicrobiota bacterium]|nr:ornithine carbamoyltransferase [Elusimicrobiota bacterium]